MFRALSAASAFVAIGAAGATLVDTADDLGNACDDDALSFLQLRAEQHHQRAPFVKSDTEFGHEVKDRPLVDENKCDVYTTVDGRAVLSEGICPLEFKDNVLGDARNGVPAQVVTGVRFFVKQAGNFGLRFLVFRNNGKLSEETEEIDVPVASVIQEYTFKKPLFLMYEDIVGFIHNGRGNIPYSEGSSDGVVYWDGDILPDFAGATEGGRTQIWQKEQHGTCGLFAMTPTTYHRTLLRPPHQARTYSYSLIVRPASKADVPEKLCLPNSLRAEAPPQSLLDSLPDAAPLPDPEPPLPDAAEGDAAAAVGDPHLTTNDGIHFDVQ